MYNRAPGEREKLEKKGLIFFVTEHFVVMETSQ